MPTLRTSQRHKLEQFTIGKTYPWQTISDATNVVLEQTVNRSSYTRRVKPQPADLIWQGTTYRHSMSRRQTPLLVVDGYIGPGDFYGPQGYLYRGTANFEETVGGSSNTDPRSVRYDYHLAPEMTPEVLSANELRNLLGDQKIDLLTGLAEYKSTAKLFVDVATPLIKDTRDYVQDVKREVDRQRRYYGSTGRTAQSRSALGIPGVRLSKKLANLHLAYVFGIKPLLGELVGAFELLTESDPRLILRVARQKRSDGYLVADGIGASPLYVPFHTTHTVSNRRKYILYGELDPITDWRTFARLGLNPFATAWELIPWSFAIDRFVQIGDALQSMGAFSGIKRATAYEILRLSRVSQCTALNQDASMIVRSTSRSKPSLNWVAPTVVNNFGSAQVVTYTALARQNLRRFTNLLFSR